MRRSADMANSYGVAVAGSRALTARGVIPWSFPDNPASTTRHQPSWASGSRCLQFCPTAIS